MNWWSFFLFITSGSIICSDVSEQIAFCVSKTAEFVSGGRCSIREEFLG